MRLEPGLWKVLIRFIQNDKPLPDKTENRCYTAAEVNDPVATFATLFPNQQCTRTHAVADNTLSFAATCTFIPYRSISWWPRFVPKPSCASWYGT